MHKATIQVEISFELGDQYDYEQGTTPRQAALAELDHLGMSLHEGDVPVDHSQLLHTLRVTPSQDEW